VPPDYWYDTSHFDPSDPTRTNVGGSWGYDSEQSAGDTVPTIDSLRRFLSPADEARLWRDPSANQYHANYEGTGHRGYAFGTLFNFDTALRHRYGRWSSLAGYVEKAQVQNYEDTRAQFEAFIDHADHAPTPHRHGRSPSSCARTCAAASHAAPDRAAETSCAAETSSSPRSGQATTSPCGQGSPRR
jgi:exo-1,4-beta-D-glucosaminidase